MKVALVYDRINKWGGAERVLLCLHEMFPDAPLYTSLYDEKKASWAKVFPRVYTSFLQKIPFVKGSHELLGFLMPFAFESFNFDKYDLVISVTSEAAKGIITRPHTKHICYMLTPTRYLWSHYDLYFKNKLLKFISKPFVKHLKSWDKIAAQRPDRMIAISSEVKARIKKYYAREAEVIFPPVKNLNSNKVFSENGKYYLLVSRLVSYKKVDLAIKAFNRLKFPLVVVGSGRKMNKLKLISKSNIKFAGQVSEKELVGYYKKAKALIMPQEEDFGICAIEAQFFGVPVIAYNKGGSLDTVSIDGGGSFFLKQEVDSIVSTVAQFNQRSVINRPLLSNNANRFSEKIFKERFKEFIERK